MASSSACARREGVSSSPGADARAANGLRREASGPDQRFPRACRLRSRRQFLTVYERGQRVSSRSFTLFGLSNGLKSCRLGVTVTRKVGGAIARNRIKRVLREIFRRNRTRLQPALDLVINAHRSIDASDGERLERELLTAFARLARRFES